MNENRLVKTILEVIKIDSPSGFEDEIGNHLFKIFSKLALRPFYDSFGNLLLNIPGKGRPLLLSAHLDTVEPGRNIKPLIKKGIIKSDGSTVLGADNKVAVASIVEVVRSLCDHQDIVHLPLEIVFTRSEEAGSLGSISLDYNQISAKNGYIFDNANPVGTIIIGSPFYNRFDIKISGQAAHASRPDDAINVLEIFSNAFDISKIGRVSNKTIMNIGTIKAGHVRNTIPGEMVIKGDVRSFLESEVDYYLELFKKSFQQSAKKIKGKVNFSTVRENSGYEYDRNDSFIQRTGQIIKNINLKPKLIKSWGCSDANIFKDHGIKVLDLGDGSINPHTTNESIAIKDLMKLANLILSLVCFKE